MKWKRSGILLLSISVALLLIIGGLIVYQMRASNGKQVVLSTLDDDECYQVLYDLGVRIPEKFSDTARDGFLNGGIRETVAILEDDPDHDFVVGSVTLHFFYEDIRAAVKEYYGIPSDTAVGDRVYK